MSATRSTLKCLLAAATLAAPLALGAPGASAAPARPPGPTYVQPLANGILGNGSFEQPNVGQGVWQGYWPNQTIGTCGAIIPNNYVMPGCWTVAAGMANVNRAGHAYDGYQSLMLNTYNSTYATVWQGVRLQPNRTYTLSMRMSEYVYAPGRVKVHMIAQSLNASGSPLATRDVVATSNGTSYRSFSMTFTTPANTTNGRIALRYVPADSGAAPANAPMIDRVAVA